ncbi:MAG: lanthionine synthetase C family protein [Bacteroidota bacterium]|nr:lanthionine synthetase C family protein [Bacteroidota bacterium]
MIEPVITNQSLFRQVRSKIDEIAEVFYNLDYQETDSSLMVGKSGIVLFLLYHARVFRNEHSNDLAFALLNQILDEIRDHNDSFTYADGLAGVAWLIEHLIQQDFLDFDQEESLEEIDRTLSKLMKLDFRHGNFDFLHGGLGYGMYFLERFKRKKDPAYLVDLIDSLDKIAIKDKNGQISWKADIHLDEIIYGVNLGMAHGLPGVIAFLSRLYQMGIDKESPLDLMEGSMKYLLQYKQDPQKYRSFFPNWILKGTPATSRLAWCYGDPGIGLAIKQAAIATNNAAWEKDYLEILENCSRRQSLSADYVMDAGLCHGTAGLAQVFNHIFQLSKDQKYHEAAEFWIRQTLEMARFHDGLAGFKAYRNNAKGEWDNEHGLLEGVAGIGLALMTSISNEKPEWDTCLLIH